MVRWALGNGASTRQPPLATRGGASTYLRGSRCPQPQRGACTCLGDHTCRRASRCCSCCCRFHWLCWMSSSIDGAPWAGVMGALGASGGCGRGGRAAAGSSSGACCLQRTGQERRKGSPVRRRQGSSCPTTTPGSPGGSACTALGPCEPAPHPPHPAQLPAEPFSHPPASSPCRPLGRSPALSSPLTGPAHWAQTKLTPFHSSPRSEMMPNPGHSHCWVNSPSPRRSLTSANCPLLYSSLSIYQNHGPPASQPVSL